MNREIGLSITDCKIELGRLGAGEGPVTDGHSKGRCYRALTERADAEVWPAPRTQGMEKCKC